MLIVFHSLHYLGVHSTTVMSNKLSFAFAVPRLPESYYYMQCDHDKNYVTTIAFTYTFNSEHVEIFIVNPDFEITRNDATSSRRTTIITEWTIHYRIKPRLYDNGTPSTAQAMPSNRTCGSLSYKCELQNANGLRLTAHCIWDEKNTSMKIKAKIVWLHFHNKSVATRTINSLRTFRIATVQESFNILWLHSTVTNKYSSKAMTPNYIQNLIQDAK